MPIKAVFGGASLIPEWTPNHETVFPAFFEALKKEGVTTIDTARLYTGSEEVIGNHPDHNLFTIDTKLEGGFKPGNLTRAQILADAQNSLERVKIDQFDILYLHAPDKTANLEEALGAIDEVHKKGIFRRFGLSNFSAEQVKEVYDIAKKNGWVLPSVYQANYNPIARHLETLLFPTLRKLGFSIYAYSPLAGGFLTKTKEQIEAGAGRFNSDAVGGLYNKFYNKPLLKEALGEWNDIAEKEGVSKAELAYRWVGYNSALKEELGDAVIFGGRTGEQVEETARALKKGPLSKEAASRIEQIWQKVKDEAPVDNFSELHKDG